MKIKRLRLRLRLKKRQPTQKEAKVGVKVKEKIFLNLKPVSLFFIFIMLSSLIFSLNPDKEINQYILDVWGIQQGLPQNTVHTIIQTRDGYLWLGTEEGLVRCSLVELVGHEVQETVKVGAGSQA